MFLSLKRAVVFAIALTLCLCFAVSTASADPGRIVTGTTAVTPHSTVAGVDVVRYHQIDLTALALGEAGHYRLAPSIGWRPFKKSGFSIAVVKLPQPTPNVGANRFGTYGIVLESRI